LSALQIAAVTYSTLLSTNVAHLVAFDSIIPLMAHRSMSDFERVKQLLDGDIGPDELELDDDLYEMAESIYGREALEEMGIIAPERPTDSINQSNGDSNHEVEVPKSVIPLPEINPIIKPKKKLWKKFLLIAVLVGASLAVANYTEYIDLVEYIEQIQKTLE